MNKLMDRFLENRVSTHMADNTYINYKLDLAQFDAYMTETVGHGDWVLFATDEQVERYMTSLIQMTNEDGSKKYENTTINRKMTSVKSFFNYCVKQKIITESPATAIETLIVHTKRKQILTIQEIRNIIDNSYNRVKGERSFGFVSARDRFIIALLTTTGLRKSELINIRLSNLDLLDNGCYMINISSKEVKNNLNKRVPIANVTLQYFKEYMAQREKIKSIKDEDVLLLTVRGTKMSDDAVEKLIHKQLEKNNLEDREITPHSFRHICTTYMRMNGENDSIIYKVLGWKEGIIDNYTNDSYLDAQKIRACNLL